MSILNTGVYMIESPSGKMYVGSAVNIRRRKNQHFHLLRRGSHHAHILQAAYDKYGALEFKTLLVCAKEQLQEYEQIVIDALAPKYNSMQSAYSPMRNPVIVAKAQAARKETIKQNKTEFGIWNIGRKNTPEQRATIAAALVGKFTLSVRAKMSAAKKKAKADGIPGNNSTPIECLTTGRIFESQAAAAEALGLNQKSINNVVRGRAKTTGGYAFKYKD